MAKYIKKFENISDANTQGASGLSSPHVSIINGKDAVNYASVNTEKFTAEFNEDGKITNVTPIIPQPNDEIWYTSSDGNVVTPYASGISVFGANIVSNTYVDGKGVIKFDAPITTAGSTEATDAPFRDCATLSSISFPYGVTILGRNALRGCTNLTLVTIPNSVTSIGSTAFYGCTSLTSITIPNSVTSIGSSAFRGCSSLISITIPNSVTSIGNYAFGNCTSLISITIPNSVTSIGDWAFYGCTSLTSINIPNSVTSIGGSAFSDCTSLTSVTVEATTPPTLGDSYVFSSTNNCPIYVPSGSVDTYKAATNWSVYASRIQAIPTE